MKSDAVYAPSDDIVARNIEGELIIVPLAAGVGDMEDELFTLNETGRAIWDELDGKKTITEIVQNLSVEYDGEEGEIEADVIGIAAELLKRRMIVAVT